MIRSVVLAAAVLGGCTRDEPRAPQKLPHDRAPATPAESERGPLVAFLGDSLSAGLHLPAEQAFPAVLRAQLSQEGQPFRLINAGVSGDTTSGGVRRVDWLLAQEPALVVIELGANDGLRGQEPAQIEQNLRQIIDKIRAREVRAMLLGIRLPPSYGEPYTKEFEAIYPRLAEQYGLPFVPFFMRGVAGEAELNLEDGMHPTARGHQLLADNVKAPLAALLRELSPPRATP